MKFKRPLAAAVGFGLLVPLAACYPQEPDAVKTQTASQWLIGQQQPDGGFEKAGFPGFETADAVFALAEQAQTGPYFDVDAARQRVESIATTGGKTPLDNIDALVDGATVPSVAASAQAAKIVALVVEPLGLNATDFDPSNNSPSPVDLIARIKAYQQPDGSLGYDAQFNGVLYGALALTEAGEEVPAGLIDQIKGAQRPDGSWNYVGDLDAGTVGDVDTTSLAMLALTVNGFTIQDAALLKGVQYLASQQEPAGSWSGNPNSTAVAAVALSALHVDLSVSGWRAQHGHPVASGSSYVSPYNWLNAQQAADGHIASVNDQYGLNTFGTSQAIQALSRQAFLGGEHQDVSYSLAYYLMTVGDTEPTDAEAAVVSNALGTNASIAAARVRAASAAVNSQAGRELAVNDLFQQAFGRDVDPSGRAYYADQLNRVDRPSILIGLLDSAEFRSVNGPSAGAYVDGLYNVLFNRDADTAGRNYWVGRINAGMSRAAVARVFVAGNEYRSGSVVDVYNLLLGRNPSGPELSAALNVLANGRIETVIAQVGGSAEYYADVTGPAASAKTASRSFEPLRRFHR